MAMKRCLLVPSDVTDLSWLSEQARKEDTIVPIGLNTLALCQSRFSDVRSIEDFVPHEKAVSLATEANDLAQKLAERFCDGERLDGYDWPSICWHAQFHFFRDLLQSEALALSLEEKEFDQVLWVGPKGEKPAYYLSTSDTVQSALRFYLGDRFGNTPSVQTGARFVLGHYENKMRNGIQRVRKYLHDPSPAVTKCHVAAFFSATEWERFTQALEDMNRAYGRAFQIWFLGGIPDHLQEWMREKGVASVTIPYPRSIDRDIIAFYRDRWEGWTEKQRHVLAQETGHRVLSSDLLHYHFDYYFNRLWPRLAQWGRRVEGYVKTAQPRWVIGSAAYSHAMAIPRHVASKLGIATVALPHAYIPGGHGLVHSSFLGSRNRFERENFRRPFPDDHRVFYCSNAGNDVSYTSHPMEDPFSHERRVISILTAEPDGADSLMSSAHRPIFLDTLAGLFSPPEDLSDLEMAIKSHPRSNISALLRKYREAGTGHVSVLEASASVIELLQETWMTVVCNHYGSVVVQAILSGKPLIFLDSAKVFWPYTTKLAFSAGEVVDDVASLWEMIRRVKRSPRLYQELSEKCRRFREAWLQPAGQTLTECLRALENGRSRGDRPGSTCIPLTVEPCPSL
jgi:hypothetical protein